MPARKRRPSNGLPVAAVAIVLVLTAARWIAAHPVFGVLALFVFAGVLVFAAVVCYRGIRIRRWRKPIPVADPYRMSPAEFEHYLADLCARDGCRNVRVVGGANDHGADVLYIDPHGRPGMIQAKRYAPGNSVGNEHVQIVNGTYRDAHSCAHAAIVTTSHFTQAAQAYAKRVGIALLDNARLDMWARGYQHAAPWN
jgi:restriction system protein